MKANEIVVGGIYTAKVSGKLVSVRVDGTRKVPKMGGTSYAGRIQYKQKLVYDVTNLKTGRSLVFSSAGKFHDAPTRIYLVWQTRNGKVLGEAAASDGASRVARKEAVKSDADVVRVAHTVSTTVVAAIAKAHKVWLPDRKRLSDSARD